MRVATVRPRRGRLTGFGCGTAILTAVGVCVVVVLAAAAVFFVSPASSNVTSSVLRAQPGALPWDPHTRLTALLLGVPGTSPQDGPSDAMTVVSFDPRTRSGVLISIPSNLWVTIPGYGQGQISQAYSDGGPRLSLLVTQSVLHIPIPYYAVLDFDTFRRLVKGFGGLTVRVPAAARLPVTGLKTLDPGLALTYIRAGNAPDTGPSGRMARIRQVLFALKNEAAQATNVVEIPTLLNGFGAAIPSNFPFDRVPDLAHILSRVPDAGFQVISLEPSAGSVTAYGHYLLPDWQSVQAAAQTAVPLDPADAGARVTVLNAAGQQGEASTLAAWLQQARIRVGSYATAPFGASHTQVVINLAARTRAVHLAEDVAALLQVPVTSRTVQGTTSPVVVIIGRDFVDPSQS